MNVSGARGDLVPRSDGTLNFAQLFALQPFGNGLIVQTLTGAQLKELLEQQFTDPARPDHDGAIGRLRLHLRPDAAGRPARRGDDARTASRSSPPGATG